MLSSLQRSIGRRTIAAVTEQTRALSFRPRRRIDSSYRPLAPRDTKKPKGPLPEDHFPDPLNTSIDLGEYESDDVLERNYGPLAADAIKLYLTGRKEMSIEESLRFADYLTTEDGTTEELILQRRALAFGTWDQGDRETFEKELDALIEEEKINMMGLGHLEIDDKDYNADGTERYNLKDELDKEDQVDEEYDDRGNLIDNDPTVLAHGDWSEVLVKVDRVQKVQRGGTLVRYRALVIGGNTNGVAGFGIAKGLEPTTVAALASKMSKRNIFFVERHLNNGLTRDLVGKHNSCKVYLRATTPGRGLVGHPLILEILKRIGISDCTAKSHGNRNMFNVVRATFKALQTHESLEEIARKRGRRLVNLERNKHLQI